MAGAATMAAGAGPLLTKPLFGSFEERLWVNLMFLLPSP